MRTLALTSALVFACTVSVRAQAPAPSAAQTAQRDRMKSCNVDAGTQRLSGAARKSFMADCLAGKSAAPAKELTPQQMKMKSCNADASA